MSSDDVLKLMRKYHIPITRANYIELAYWGKPPVPWTPEHEDMLPFRLRKPIKAA
jgi:hypothetical protein